MFDIQLQGQFIDIADSEKIAFVISSSLFEIDVLAGSYTYDLKALDSAKNNELFQFIENIDSPKNFSAKYPVVFWLFGAPYSKASMTVKRAHSENGYQIYLAFGISNYSTSIFSQNLKKLDFGTPSYYLAKELDNLPFRIEAWKVLSSTYANYRNIILDFETSLTNGPKTLTVLNSLEKFYSGSFYYVKLADLNLLIDNLNDALETIYDGIGELPEFEFSLLIQDELPGIVGCGVLQLDNVTMQTGKSLKLQVNAIRFDPVYVATFPTRIDLRKFEFSGGFDFTGNPLSGGVFIGALNLDYWEKRSEAVQKEMFLMASQGQSTAFSPFPFVFAPYKNVGFYKNKPSDFIGEINAFDASYLTSGRYRLNQRTINHYTGDIDCTELRNYNQGTAYSVSSLVVFSGDYFRCIFATSAGESPSSNPAKWQKLTGVALNKYVVSPQLRVFAILQAIERTSPNVFDFSDIYNNPTPSISYFIGSTCLYNNFSILDHIEGSIDGSVRVGYLSSQVRFMDLLPNKTVYEFLNSIRKLFNGHLGFDFLTGKIKFSLFRDSLTLSNVEDISHLVSTSIEKTANSYDSIFLHFTPDNTDEISQKIIKKSDYIYLTNITVVDGLGRPIFNEVGSTIEDILIYCKEEEILFDEIEKPDWAYRFLCMTVYGYYLFDPKTNTWGFAGYESSDIYTSSGLSPFEIDLGSAGTILSKRIEITGWDLPLVSQPGNERTYGYITNDLFNNDFGFRFFTFDFWYNWPGWTIGSERNAPRARPFRFVNTESYVDGYNYDLPIYEYMYKDFADFAKNTVGVKISLRPDELFLQRFKETKTYRIGSQLVKFKELRVEVPKSPKKGKFKADADVFLLRNYSIP